MAQTLHVLAVPHTITHSDWNACAFQEKVRKFIKMMALHSDYEIIHYGHADSEIFQHPRVQHVTVTDNQLFEQAYGTEYTQEQAWRQKGFAAYFKVNDLVYTTFSANCTKELAKRKKPNDILCCTFGWGHKAIADANPDLIAIETGIGYGSTCLRWRIFESNYIRAAAQGIEAVNTCNQDYYSAVIPNYFQQEDFEFRNEKDPYVLYLGRVYTGKGVDVAIEATAQAGKRLIIAGQGLLKDMGYSETPSHVTELGYADIHMRKQLMSRAQALFIASKYGEPFAGVQVEAWLSGTPVISPDYACFAEMNVHGITGYRCRTFKDYVTALNNIDQIDPKACRIHGEQYTLDKIAPQYIKYFQDVTAVYTGKGWYEL